MTRPHDILVQGTKTGLPYSKGLLASSLTAVGIAPDVAFEIAARVEDDLRDAGARTVGVDELRVVVADLLRHDVGSDAAADYLSWQAAQERDRPLIVLLGGATGVGKSTVATLVATQLGITRIVSTDAIREVMRATVPHDLLPWLHVSSFEAVDVARTVPASSSTTADPVLIGFLRQTAAVGVGISQVLRRAVIERTDTIIEGVHLVPGVTTLPDLQDAVVVQLVLAIEDVDVHRSHLTGRGQGTPLRGRERYLDRVDEIRRIQAEMILRAGENDVAVLEAYALDRTVSEVVGHAVRAVTAATPVRRDRRQQVTASDRRGRTSPAAD